MKYEYECKDNPAILNFIESDGLIDEIWIKPQKEEDVWLVIGFHDLLTGMTKALKKFKKFYANK